MLTEYKGGGGIDNLLAIANEGDHNYITKPYEEIR